VIRDLLVFEGDQQHEWDIGNHKEDGDIVEYVNHPSRARWVVLLEYE